MHRSNRSRGYSRLDGARAALAQAPDRVRRALRWYLRATLADGGSGSLGGDCCGPRSYRMWCGAGCDHCVAALSSKRRIKAGGIESAEHPSLSGTPPRHDRQGAFPGCSISPSQKPTSTAETARTSSMTPLSTSPSRSSVSVRGVATSCPSSLPSQLKVHLGLLRAFRELQLQVQDNPDVVHRVSTPRGGSGPGGALGLVP
jgi:hypothetical protein